MRAVILALLLLLAPGLATAQSVPAAAECQMAVAAAEHAGRLPQRLLTTISLVESGRLDPDTGRLVAWPWTINAGGIGFFYRTKAEAVAAARALHASGIASIDVGCMQISLLYHPNAFATLEDAFDPPTNAAYGARFLASLYGQLGNWPAAAGAYHSQTPELGAEYQRRVMALWPLAAKYPALPAPVTARPDGTSAPDFTNYTPEHRAALRQVEIDRARLLALYGKPPAPPPPPPRPPIVQARGPVSRIPTAPLWNVGGGEVPRDLLTSR